MKIQKMGRGKQFAQGKGKQCGKATLSGPASQDYVAQIPNGMSCGEGQTHSHACPKILEFLVIPFLEQAAT
jgi:hypothetical protein